MRQRGWAWVAMAIAIALHVADEATHDFLSLYNPAAEAIHRAVPFLPVPVFTFPVWIAGLTAGVTLMLAVSPAVFRSARWTRPVCYIVPVLMVLNSVGHVAGSLYLGRPAPGVYSSPVLAAAAVWLFMTTRRVK
ncbi:MAG: hypothetical protein LLG20_25620 [Acidobacteriales bacterium]|nr:hypothetical protein [Terriglobales bacterium]